MQWWQFNTRSVWTQRLIHYDLGDFGAKQKYSSKLMSDTVMMGKLFTLLPSVYEFCALPHRSLFWDWSIFFSQQLRLSQNWSQLLFLSWIYSYCHWKTAVLPKATPSPRDSVPQKKEPKYLVGPFGFWNWHISYGGY